MGLFQNLVSWAALTASLASLAIHHFGHIQHSLLIDELGARLRELEGAPPV